jgi:hypothetical protein
MKRRRPLLAGLAAIAIVAVLLAAVLALAVRPLGGSPAANRSPTLLPSATQSAPTPSSSPSGPTPSASPSPSPSPSGSASPSPHPSGFVQTADGLVYYAEDGTAVPVQAVPGLAAELRGGKALYFALPANRYGLAEGAYGGEFQPNVTTQQADGSSAQTGGIVVVGPVASRLIADRLAGIKTGRDRWIVALPVDIRSEPQLVEVSFDTFGLHGWSDTPRVTVEFSGSLPVVNVVPANTGYHVLVEQLGVTRWQVIDPLRLQLSTSEIDPSCPMNELLLYGDGTPSVWRDVYQDERVAVGQVMLNATGEVSVSLVVPGSRADLGPDKVLMVGDVPVFVASL